MLAGRTGLGDDYSKLKINARVGNVRNDFEFFLGPHAVPGPTNDNGQRLLDTCVSNYTRTSNSGTHLRAQLDHMLINRWWQRSLLDCRTNRGEDIRSDHELVVAKLRLKLNVAPRSTMNTNGGTEN